MLSISSRKPVAKEDCRSILGKIDFLLKVQRIADGVDQVEPLLEDLVDRIKGKEELCRQQIVDRFLALMEDLDPWSLEIIQYCMHEFRWAEILERADDMYRHEVRVGKRRLYERLRESFDVTWPEREFFRRYSDL